MPRLNRKGPLGEGPRTGWGLGRCRPRPEQTGNRPETSSFNEDLPDRGHERPFGRGRGRRMDNRPGRGGGRCFGNRFGFGRKENW